MSPRTERNRLNARRRFAAAVLAIVGVAGLGIASAAQLNLSASAISAGSTLISSCQALGTTITVTFPTTFSATPPPAAYRVSTVKLTNVSSNCDTKAYSLQLLNNSGVALGTLTEVTGNLAVVGGIALITVGTVDAAAVGGVALVVQG